MQLLNITQNDTVREGRTDRLEENDFVNRPTNPLGADSFTYNPGSGSTTSNIDSAFTWNVTVTLGDGSTFTTRIPFAQLENGAVITNVGTAFDNLNIQSIRLDSFDSGNYFGLTPNRSIDGGAFVCFTRGTQIATREGYVAVEDLSAGDRVMTMDNGYQEIRWIGSRKIDAIDLKMHPKLLPIRIKAGAMGPNAPTQDLTVSPQHRMLIRSAIATRMFDRSEVLVPAKKLLALDGVDIVEDATEVEYFHILFDRHEIIIANGAPSESLFTGSEALKSLSLEAYEEITTLFPHVLAQDYEPIPARYIPQRGKLMTKLAQRHQSNRKSLLQGVQ
ncbi:Hint domain-containing protein [Roseovarius sp. M141]|nr:Hint domain-containing protein [Roseovarius sp. M141]